MVENYRQQLFELGGKAHAASMIGLGQQPLIRAIVSCLLAAGKWPADHREAFYHVEAAIAVAAYGVRFAEFQEQRDADAALLKGLVALHAEMMRASGAAA